MLREKFKQLGKDSIIYAIGNIVSRFLSVILLPILTRVFSPGQYGVIDIIATLSAIASIFIILGFETATGYYYYQTDNSRERRTILSTSLYFRIIFSIFVSSLLFLYASEISFILFKNNTYTMVFRVAILTIPVNVVISSFTDIFRISFKPFHYIFVSLFRLVLSITFISYFILVLKIGLIGVYYGYLLSGFLTLIVALWLSRNNLSFVFSIKKLKGLFDYGAPLLFAGLSLWVLNFAGRYFLLHFSDLHEIGLYSAGYKISMIVTIITYGFRRAHPPMLYSVSREKIAKDFYSRILTYYLIGSISLALIVTTFAKEILIIVTPPEYWEGYKVVGILSLSAVTYGLSSIVGTGLLLAKRTIYVSIAFFAAAICNIGFNILLIQAFGIVGAALATLFSFIVANILIFYFSQRYYFINYEIYKVLRLSLMAIISLVGLSVCSKIAPHGDLALRIGMLWIFFLLLVVFKVLKISELKNIFLGLSQIGNKDV